MFTYLVDEISTRDHSEGGSATEAKEAKLAASIDELARLRISAVLTARFATSPNQPPERQEELRERLAELRRQYFDKIDQIAMTLGVETAMKAKEEVERTVSVPRGTGI